MKKLFLFFCLLFITGIYSSNAQFTYPNDICSGAMPIPVSNYGQLSDSVFQRLSYADPANSTIPGCNGSTNNTRHDLWYSFIATDTSIAVVPEHLFGGGILYQLFTGNCGSLTSLQCNPNGTTFPNLGGLIIGQQYYLRTYYGGTLGWNDDASNYKLSLLAMPVNDVCTGAFLLPINAPGSPTYTSTRFSNAQATASTDASCASNAGWAGLKDVWYKFVATSTRHTIYSGSTARVQVYSGTPGSLTSIGSLINGFAGHIPLTNLTIGSTYYIRAGASNTVTIKLGIFQGEPGNDECANADTVLVSSGFTCENNFAVNRLLATTSTTPFSPTIYNDVWYVFKATVADITVTCTDNSGISNTNLSLLSGTCGAMTSLVNAAAGTFTYSGLVPGNYYYLQVGRTSTFITENTNYICIAPKLSNDECSGAIGLQIKPYNVLRTNVGSIFNATQTMPGCQTAQPIADVWYSFTATDTACFITVDAAETTGTYFEVLTGNCAALNSFYCSSASLPPNGSTERTERVGALVVGNTYFVRYYSGSNGVFTIDINSLPPNDECSGATTLTAQQGLGYETMFNNGILHASTSLPACAAAAVTKDIWYKFTATQSSMAIISNCENPATVLGYELYSGSCAALTSMACVQQGTVVHKAQTFTNLVPGNLYYIRQYGDMAKNRISIIERPINDEMAGAVKLTIAPANVQSMPSYYLHGASKQFGKICSNATYTINHDVWFYFIANEASHTVSANAFNSFWAEQIAGYTYRLEAFSGYGADSLSLVAKAKGCAAGSLTVNGLAAGDTVYVRVSNTSAAGNTSIFSLKVAGTQSMDEPAGALTLDKLNVFQYSLNTTGATQTLPAANCLVADNADDDIWLKFTASASIKRIVAAYESRDITLQLFSGTAGNLTAMQCSNEIMVLPTNLINGTVYYVRAYSKANALAATFNIGLYGEDDMLANNCVGIAGLGTNMVANPRCESDYKYILPKNDKGAVYPGSKLAEGWWSSQNTTADMWNADYPYTETWGNTPGSINNNTLQVPRSGKGMLGILYQIGANWNEYITGKLAQPLVAGKTYLVSFYVVARKGTGKSVFNLGAYLSNDSLINGNAGAFEITPHIAHAGRITSDDEWVNICGLFYADKPYNFITIGNFGSRSLYGSELGGYYHVDDVAVAEVLNPVVLPLNLINFTGRTNAQQQTELTWQTSNEVNTKNFEVQWRSDESQFTNIGNVDAKGNAYNSYDFVHHNPADGYNYYRLKMFDIDGSFTYSAIVRTGAKINNNNISVYPNPVAASVNISVQSAKDELVFFRLINSNGSTVSTKSFMIKKGSNALSWNIASLAAGNYIISSSNKTFDAVQIIKQ